MNKKNLFLYIIILILLILFLWQWISKGALLNQLTQLNQVQQYNNQLQTLSGIGPLHSAHLHADVKVYINGKAIDFSQKKYQLTSSFIHFEEGVGDVIHTHATGLTIGHMLKSVGIGFNNNCMFFEGQNYCNEGSKSLKFYVNSKPNNGFDNYVIKDLDRYLISFGSENDSEIQKQLDSVTHLAPKYSASSQE